MFKEPEEFLADALGLLAAAPHQKKLDERVICLANQRELSQRLVVLRGFDSAQHRLSIFTDSRSQKTKAFIQGDLFHGLYWNSRHRLQIAMKLQPFGEPKQDPKLWASLSQQQHRDYLSVAAPGEPLSHHDNQEFLDTGADVKSSYFAELWFQILSFDILCLSSPQHWRLHYKPASHSSQWIQP